MKLKKQMKTALKTSDTKMDIKHVAFYKVGYFYY